MAVTVQFLGADYTKLGSFGSATDFATGGAWGTRRGSRGCGCRWLAQQARSLQEGGPFHARHKTPPPASQPASQPAQPSRNNPLMSHTRPAVVTKMDNSFILKLPEWRRAKEGPVQVVTAWQLLQARCLAAAAPPFLPCLP